MSTFIFYHTQDSKTNRTLANLTSKGITNEMNLVSNQIRSNDRSSAFPRFVKYHNGIWWHCKKQSKWLFHLPLHSVLCLPQLVQVYVTFQS